MRTRRLGGGLLALVVLMATVLVATVLAASAPAAGASLKDQIGAAQERARALGRSVARQQALISDLERDQAATREAMAATDQQLDAINADLRAVRERIERVTAALARVTERHAALVDEQRQTDYTLGLLEQELANGEADLKVRRQALGRRLAEAARAENATLLEQVFTADSFSDVLTEASAYLAYGDQDAQLAGQIAQDQQALDGLRLLTTATRLQTDKLRRETLEVQDEITARRQQLEAAKRRLARLEARTQRILRAQEARYRTLVSNEREARRLMREQAAAERALRARIAGLVRQAQASAARRSSVQPGSGGFLDWPTSGIVTQEYGCTGFYLEPPVGSCAHFHDGIDIANGTGTPIRAAADGVVAFAGTRIDGSNIVVLGHAGGYETSYGHLLASFPVSPGQFVKQGAVVGYMGCTGLCTGPHVHFEVRRNGQTLDPRSVL